MSRPFNTSHSTNIGRRSPEMELLRSWGHDPETLLVMRAWATYQRDLRQTGASPSREVFEYVVREMIRADARQEQHMAERLGRCVVYFVQNDAGDQVKIGYTSHLPTRMSALRRPMSAVLVTVPGGQDTEAQMHAAFAHLRIGRSEWFHVAPDLMDFIDHLISQQAA